MLAGAGARDVMNMICPLSFCMRMVPGGRVTPGGRDMAFCNTTDDTNYYPIAPHITDGMHCDSNSTAIVTAPRQKQDSVKVSCISITDTVHS